ncbi:MAG: tetratricopeptide repeat protein [Desulfovibrionaceae bacterium]|nr:tetratricopeptide repeat protein [Desulfovibrionaceae bacterium]
MASRKVFVQMGRTKSRKSKKAHSAAFKGALQGKNPETLLSLAVAETRKAAEGGDAQAHYLMGLAYAEGSGVRQDVEEAFRCFGKAAAMGLAEAQSSLAALCYAGIGCTQNKEQAMAWWAKAAEQAEPTAQYYYGRALFVGDGVAQDKAQGFHLLRQAAKQGISPAAELLRTPEMLTFAMQC